MELNLFTWEVAANAVYAASVVFAARNSVHTWWLGIIGCVLFGYVFHQSQLYADMTLQAFFIATSAIGWWNWLRGDRGDTLPIRRTARKALVVFVAITLAVGGAYAWLLHRFTHAYAPVPDSLAMAFSILAQLLLMGRRIETWWCWLIVNTISVPLFWSRGLHATAILYAGFWVNALVALRRWRAELKSTPRAAARSVPRFDP